MIPIPYIIAALIVSFATGAGLGGWKGYAWGQEAVQAKWDTEKKELAEEHAKNMEVAREKEQALQAASDKLRQEKDREIRNVNARATALANSLRERPEAPGANSAAAESAGHGQAPAGCTGAELYRAHGEFLVGEAARAENLKAALKQCYAQYDEVKGR